MNIYFCIEDQLSRSVAERLISDFCPPNTTSQELGKAFGGYGHIKANLHKYHNLSSRAPVFIVTDLDRFECPPSLRRSWLNQANIAEPLPENMLFCVAKTEIESWLLADTLGICDLLQISGAKLSKDIENSVIDAKEYLVRLAKVSRNSNVKKDLVPLAKSSAATGINYNFRLSEFVKSSWNPHRAAENNASLRRAIQKLGQLTP